MTLQCTLRIWTSYELSLRTWRTIATPRPMGVMPRTSAWWMVTDGSLTHPGAAESAASRGRARREGRAAHRRGFQDMPASYNAARGLAGLGTIATSVGVGGCTSPDREPQVSCA